jgi:hypothetical protein
MSKEVQPVDSSKLPANSNEARRARHILEYLCREVAVRGGALRAALRSKGSAVIHGPDAAIMRQERILSKSTAAKSPAFRGDRRDRQRS